MTTQEIAARFDELAQKEEWFQIQDELFADDAKSIEPAHAQYLKSAEGMVAIRKKGEDLMSQVEALHRAYTSAPIVTGNHFAVVRETDLTVKGAGRVKLDQIMLYEVRDGKIISEQFFY
jgi:ketosteroid isomerase-like protein